MKQLTCEMCGSTELIKQDGYFVCQVCGCKYSVEEAKKMMIEGTVEVQGTVKVDNSALVEKYLANARRAKEKEDWEETEKYYNLVEQNDPNNIEAIFYSSYGKAKASLVDGDIYKRQAAFKVLNNCVSIIDDKYQIEDKEENEVAIKSMAIDLLNMFGSSFVFTEWKDGYGIVTRTNKPETYALFVQLIDAFHASILNIQEKDPEVYMYETFISFVNSCKLYTFEGYSKSGLNNVFDGWITQQKEGLEKIRKNKINKYWEEHKEEKIQLENEKSQLEKIKERCISEIATLQKKKEKVPSMPSLIKKQKEIETLENEKRALGLFKFKEKKAVQEKIDALNLEKNKIKDKVNTEQKEVSIEIEKEIEPIRTELNKTTARLKEIEEELTKDR